MTDQTENYQRKMQEQYEAPAKYRLDKSEVRMRRESYSVDATVEFKRENWPADPFEEGVLVDAAYLDIPDLVAIFRASKNLEAAVHQTTANTLILSRASANLTPLVRVNPLFVNRLRQQKVEVTELLQKFYCGDYQSFEAKRQEIIGMGDAQLLKFVRQVEELLGLTERELKAMEVIDEN